MKTRSQPQSVNAPSVRYHHLAHSMKHPQIKWWPHCPTTNASNQRKSAKAQERKSARTQRKQTITNRREPVQTTTANSKTNAKAHAVKKT